MHQNVYINATASFFPNEAVDNENIERVLGLIAGKASRSRSIVLGSNQIKTRHYAIDPVTRAPTHSNAQITAEAIRIIFRENPELKLTETPLLCVGTTAPDLLVPAHGQMVQGLLKDFSGEVMTSAGVCCSSMSALKSAYTALKAGEAPSAVVTGSEVASKFMRSEFFESEVEEKVGELKSNPLVAFEHDFLRWMLSDGAGAFYLSTTPLAGKTNLKINWVEGRSYANEQPVCMFAGGHREKDSSVTSWKDLRLIGDAKKLNYAMNFRQDIRQLKEEGPTYTIKKPLTEIKKKRGLRPGDYSWFLAHYSSDYFREVVQTALKEIDFDIPHSKWFSTLEKYGNIGSASILVFVDQLIRTKKLNAGEKILCFIPESARMSAYFMELEVV